MDKTKMLSPLMDVIKYPPPMTEPTNINAKNHYNLQPY